jgi:general secretion pathway protein D
LIASALRRAALVCFVSLVFTAHVFASTDDKVSLNFVNADIPEVIKAISTISGKNFLVDPRVKGTINIVSATPVSSALAYDILLTALRMQGFAAVESHGITKVMPEADAKMYIASVSSGHGSEDKLVTKVYILKYKPASQLVSVLRPLIPPSNIVEAYPDSNALVVTDYASNLKRIGQIVDAMDQPETGEPVIIPVKHASAVDLAQTINLLMRDNAPSGADANARFVVLADTRTNDLLVRIDNPARLARVRELVDKLDVATGAPGNMHVIYLKNAEAVSVAKTLRAVLSGNAETNSTVSQGGSAALHASMSQTNPLSKSSKNSGSEQITGGGMVQADQASNSLIITAPPAVYNNLRAVVDMLDVRRAQVYVEALIAEVTADKVADFGIQWQGLNGAGATGSHAAIIGGTNLGARGVGGNILDAASNLSSVTQGLNIGIVKGQITIPGVGTVLNLGMLANLLETDANANILSMPNLLTLDNEEAKIIVGQNVPFITGQYAQTGSATTATPFQTIERQDVGLTLSIKPQITEDGTVKLEIYQEVSSVDPQSINNAAGLITNKRSLESTILVDNGQTVVLGGLIQDSVTLGKSKVPILGSLPVLGYLFQSETRQHSKTDLMVFLRPHILRTDVAANDLTQERYDYIRGEQKNSKLPSNVFLPDMPPPQMPPLKNDIQGLGEKPGGAASGLDTASTPDVKQPERQGAAAQNSIQGLSLDSGSNGRLVIKVSLKNTPIELPHDFTISAPPRIAFDFPNTTNGLGKSVQEFNVRDLRSANIVQAGNRTRLVVNLNQKMAFETRIDGNDLLITLEQDKAAKNK